MTSYWAAYAWLPDGCEAGVSFDVQDGRFAKVRSGVQPQADQEILSGVTLPGLANGHSHAFHRALRGRTHAGGGSFWTWREQMYALATRLDPDSYLALARAVFAEMVLAGYTVVGEFHYLHHDQRGRPYGDPNAMGAALIQAATEAGIRLTLLDVCYLAGGLAATGHLPLDPVQTRFSDGNVDHWQQRVSLLVDRDLVRMGTAVHSVRAVPAEALGKIGDVAGSVPYMSISANSRPRTLLLRPTTAAPPPSCSMIMVYSVPALLSYTPPISPTATSRPWAPISPRHASVRQPNAILLTASARPVGWPMPAVP